MLQAHKFQDLEDTGKALVEFVRSSQPDRLKKVKVEQQALFEKHLETKKMVTEILKDIAQIEESVGQRLLDMEQEQKHRQSELENLEEQLLQCTAKSQMMDSEIQFLQKELERLKNYERELETLQHEVDEDTTEIIPTAVYVAQVYYIITNIKWEFNTEPNILRGVHYGPELATPISIDTSAQSRCEISDQLWGFVSTEW